jgi:hypothetical protein
VFGRPTTDDDGKPRTSTTDVVDELLLTKTDVTALREAMARLTPGPS